jgi:hypothetical protein
MSHVTRKKKIFAHLNMITSHLPLVQRLKLSVTVPSFPLHASSACKATVSFLSFSDKITDDNLQTLANYGFK